jgi:hypothetical protein
MKLPATSSVRKEETAPSTSSGSSEVEHRGISAAPPMKVEEESSPSRDSVVVDPPFQILAENSKLIKNYTTMGRTMVIKVSENR